MYISIQTLIYFLKTVRPRSLKNVFDPLIHSSVQTISDLPVRKYVHNISGLTFSPTTFLQNAIYSLFIDRCHSNLVQVIHLIIFFIHLSKPYKILTQKGRKTSNTIVTIVLMYTMVSYCRFRSRCIFQDVVYIRR